VPLGIGNGSGGALGVAIRAGSTARGDVDAAATAEVAGGVAALAAPGSLRGATGALTAGEEAQDASTIKNESSMVRRGVRRGVCIGPTAYQVLREIAQFAGHWSLENEYAALFNLALRTEETRVLEECSLRAVDCRARTAG